MCAPHKLPNGKRLTGWHLSVVLEEEEFEGCRGEQEEDSRKNKGSEQYAQRWMGKPRLREHRMGATAVGPCGEDGAQSGGPAAEDSQRAC